MWWFGECSGGEHFVLPSNHSSIHLITVTDHVQKNTTRWGVDFKLSVEASPHNVYCLLITLWYHNTPSGVHASMRNIRTNTYIIMVAFILLFLTDVCFLIAYPVPTSPATCSIYQLGFFQFSDTPKRFWPSLRTFITESAKSARLACGEWRTYGTFASPRSAAMFCVLLDKVNSTCFVCNFAFW